MIEFFNNEDILGLKDLLKPSNKNGFNDIYILT